MGFFTYDSNCLLATFSMLILGPASVCCTISDVVVIVFDVFIVATFNVFNNRCFAALLAALAAVAAAFGLLV